MKKNLIFLFMVFALCTSAQTIKQIWSTGKIFQVPESVLYYHNSDVLFVSNIVGNPSGEDGRGFISKLSTQGKIINLKWITGLNAPKGMAVFNDKLYVADINAADLGYIPATQTILIPTFFDNRVVAWLLLNN